MNFSNAEINNNTVINSIINDLRDGPFKLNFFNVFCAFIAWIILVMTLGKQFYFPRYEWKIHYLSNKWTTQILSQRWSVQILCFVNKHIEIWGYIWVALLLTIIITYIIISIYEVKPHVNIESESPNVISIFNLGSVLYKVKRVFAIVVTRLGFILCILMYSARITLFEWYKWVRFYSDNTTIGDARGSLSCLIIFYYLYAAWMIIKWMLTQKIHTYSRCINAEALFRDYLILNKRCDFYLCVRSYKGVLYYRIFKEEQRYNSRKKMEKIYISPENGFFKQYEDCLRCFNVLVADSLRKP